jgi:hypothetical protein
MLGTSRSFGDEKPDSTILSVVMKKADRPARPLQKEKEESSERIPSNDSGLHNISSESMQKKIGGTPA